MKKEDLDVFFKQFVVIVVLYKNDLFTTPAYISLNESAKRISEENQLEYFIFDNSPENIYNDADKISEKGWFYKYDASNPGLSKPSNEGVALANKLEKKWVLFTNPDTLYSEDYFETLINAIKLNPSIELLSPILKSESNIVSPANYRFFIGSSPESVSAGVNSVDNKLILYSGIFITLNAFYRSGGFKDEIKLDFMDCYFMENYRKHYSSFYLLNSTCEHDLSSYEKNVEKVLKRFEFYCEGARYFASSFGNFILLFSICVLRSFKLSLKFRDLRFILVNFKTIST